MAIVFLKTKAEFVLGFVRAVKAELTRLNCSKPLVLFKVAKSMR